MPVAYALLRMGEGIHHPASKRIAAVVRLEDFDLGAKTDLLAALGQYGGDFAGRTLRDLLDDKKIAGLVRLEAARSLWKLTHGGRAVEELEALAGGTDPGVAAEAVLALARAGRPRSRPCPGSGDRRRSPSSACA